MRKGFTLIRTIRKNLTRVKGFTLIELLVVVSIIGVLLGLSVFGLQGARQSSRDAKRKSDLEMMRSGLEIYKADCDVYPLASQVVSSTALEGTGSPSSCAVANIYISSVPKDSMDPASKYAYSRPTTTAYILCASLEQIPSPAMDVTGCGSCGTGVTCNYKVTNP